MNTEKQQQSDAPQARPILSILRTAAAVCLFGTLLGIGYVVVQTQHDVTVLPPEASPTITLPSEGIQTDAFSVALLQKALAAKNGNVTVAPAMVTELIIMLQELDDKDAAETCRRFGLREEQPSPATLPHVVMHLFADESQRMGLDVTNVTTVPMQRDPAHATAIVNKLVLPEQRYGDLIVTTSDMGEGKELLAVANADFSPGWLQPINREHTQNLPFESTFGGADVPTMHVAGQFRVAKAEDEAWTAVALFFRREQRVGDSVCLVVVQPNTFSARRFAEKMTPQQVSEIRSALAHATPRSFNLQLPVFTVQQEDCALLPLLADMGIQPMPKSRADGKTNQPAVGHAVVRYRVNMCEDEAAVSEGTIPGYPQLQINRSYLWWVGTLTESAPFLFMGVVERPQ